MCISHVGEMIYYNLCFLVVCSCQLLFSSFLEPTAKCLFYKSPYPTWKELEWDTLNGRLKNVWVRIKSEVQFSLPNFSVVETLVDGVLLLTTILKP